MSIPNPYPNIADKEMNDVKTWSSAKIINELQPALDTEITCKETYEGNIVTFNNLANKEITSLDCEILPIQEGTGTPSPSNPRPISGTSVLDIYHSGADTSDYDTTSVALGQEIMGGTADVVGGVGESTHKLINLADLTWTLQNGAFYSQPLTDAKAVTDAQIFNGVSSHFVSISYNYLYAKVTDNSIAQSSSKRIYIYSSSITTLEQLETAIADAQLAYELATPTEFTFTGQPINSYLGVNNVWTDSGNIKVTTDETATIGNILKERGILP